MKFIPTFLATLAALLTGYAQARDDVLLIPVAEVMQFKDPKAHLDGSIAFHFAGQDALPKRALLGEDVSNKKVMLTSKNDRADCNRAALDALFTLQEGARRKGANAVVELVGYHMRDVRANADAIECHVGTWHAGVTLKGSYARIGK